MLSLVYLRIALVVQFAARAPRPVRKREQKKAEGLAEWGLLGRKTERVELIAGIFVGRQW